MSGDISRKRLHAVVQGRVQGVGFRYFVLERAGELQLVGVVRNLRNGDVEVIAEGEEGPLEALLVALHNGPRMSHVENVHVAWTTPTGEFVRFSSGATYN
ncbi:MAG: acylphosphatase [Armatimonadota bacterium]|nr:acylphosphatase [bacterium]